MCTDLLPYQGTNKIRGKLIDLAERHTTSLHVMAFNNMDRLRHLIVNDDAHISPGSIFLPNELGELNWPNCPLESLPSNFGENLTVLRMSHSQLKGLEGNQVQLLFLGKLCHEPLMLLHLFV